MDGQIHDDLYTGIRKLYPTLSEQEIKVAEANFRRYVEIAAEMIKERDAAADHFDRS